ncbi:hypothetical protein BCR44DRAFT_1434036, partial [Catenaria anguillulae PL171]
AAPNSSGLVNQVPARLLPTCGFPRHVSVFSSANQSNWRSPPLPVSVAESAPICVGWLACWLAHSPRGSIRSSIVYVKSPPWRVGNPWWTVRNWREDQGDHNGTDS